MNKCAIESVRENSSNALLHNFFTTFPLLLSVTLAACMLGHVLLLTLIMLWNTP